MDIQINVNSDPVDQAKADETLVVEPQKSVREVFALLKEAGSGSVLVVEKNRPVGIFTERDALRLMATGGDLDVPVSSAMTADPVTIRSDSPLADAVRTMSRGGYRRLPLVDEAGELVGVVKVSGIVHYFVDHFPATVFNLPPDPNVVMPEREGA